MTIPNGVDIDRFRPKETGQDSGAVVIGGAGQLVATKRFDIAIEAVGLLSRDLPVRLRIAGSGPNEPELRRRAAECGVADIVELAGAQQDMSKFLRSLDVFVMTFRQRRIAVRAIGGDGHGLAFGCDGRWGFAACRTRRIGRLRCSPTSRTSSGGEARATCEESHPAENHGTELAATSVRDVFS